MTDCGKQTRDVVDHRTRIGQARRRKTEDKLIKAAILVFAERGLNGTVIDHVVQRAGVSRGTFYNYFDTIEGVREAARVALGREVMLLVKDAVDYDRPAPARVAQGIHAFIAVARQNRMFLEFTARLGRHSYSFAEMLRETAPNFLAAGIEEGAFRPVPEALVYDLLETGTSALLRRLKSGEEVDVAAFVAAMLRVFGVSYDLAAEVAADPIATPHVPEDSLLARGNATWRPSQP
ncbi:TetR/AcrR family transcriptional regulator [Celeribacter neptunius]|uniref:Transcriptional regulator, TetR family n=1 Tax=Celeribacter neptunius TaxID=588602 RepID=A0A1I3UK50_9RHOB|nr:TetR/AcrR family transcriptional regulator [Celeribacter neptunius]SFJ82117.1 transcriptional regulator, TetR family [Celeribacter neptunius]